MNQSLIFSKLSDWNLISKSEPVVELFFLKPNLLPKNYQPEKKYNIGFALVNREATDKKYYYDIVQKNNLTGAQTVLLSSDVVVAKNQEQPVQVAINYVDGGDSSTILISLRGYNQMISYNLNKDFSNE